VVRAKANQRQSVLFTHTVGPTFLAAFTLSFFLVCEMKVITWFFGNGEILLYF